MAVRVGPKRRLSSEELMLSNWSARENSWVLWGARRSNQSILKEINPIYSLEGLILKIKLQYFGYLMRRADSMEKTLMLGKTEGKKRRGQQRIRWLNSITDSMDISLSKLWVMVKEREAWRAAVHELTKSHTWLNDWRNVCHSLYSKEQVSVNFMAAVIICSDYGAQENKVCHCFHFFPSICHEVMGWDAMIVAFWMLSFKPDFSLAFTLIRKLFSCSSLSAIRVVSSAHLRLLIFLLVILIPACDASSPAFCMMYSEYKLNKQSDNIQPWHTPFPIWNPSVVPCPVLTVAFDLHTGVSVGR